MKLKDRVAVVTGAGRGIGKAIAFALAAEGAKTVLADRDIDAATQAAAELDGHSATAMLIDVTEPNSIQDLFETVIANHGRLDILINNAGIGTTRLFVDTDLQEWERTIRVNLTGSFLCGQQAARQMMRQNVGRIINITSLSGQKGGIGRAAYGASKAGLELLTKVMAVELAEYGINVNAIAPGPIMTDTAKAMHTQETREAYHRLIPQRRYGEASEVASAALFLVSDEARYITGHTLNVDGGFLAAGLLFPFDPNRRVMLSSI
jgi:NAD(P)-dependent dehydrogenase (short-subunit alcohol dehydrogenase family)